MTTAASSYQQPQYHHEHRPLKIWNRDDSYFMRAKAQTIAKRKSAVELLQETKPLYVKSEIVLDRKQELRRSLRGYQLPGDDEEPSNGCGNGVTGLLGRSSNSTSPPPGNSHASQNTNSSSSSNGGTSVSLPLPKSPRLIPPPPAFRKSTCSLQLQNKLRKLLNADSKENLLEINSATANGENTPSGDPSGRFEYYNPETAFATNKNYGKEIDFNCHKSLPDLTNVRDLSSRSEKSDVGSCGCPPCSASSDGICKKSSHTDCVSLASCKNDCLHASTDCCDETDKRNYTNSADETNNPNFRGNSLPASPVKSSTSYISPPSLYCDTSEQFKSRPVLRSKSDVGARNASSLEPVDIPLYDSSNLNMFFDNIGLEADEYSSLTAARSNASSPVYFESSDSSADSVGGHASGNDNATASHAADSPSIVERNARVIKWLCNCRKAFEQVPRVITPTPQST